MIKWCETSIPFRQQTLLFVVTDKCLPSRHIDFGRHRSLFFFSVQHYQYSTQILFPFIQLDGLNWTQGSMNTRLYTIDYSLGHAVCMQLMSLAQGSCYHFNRIKEAYQKFSVVFVVGLFLLTSKTADFRKATKKDTSFVFDFGDDRWRQQPRTQVHSKTRFTNKKQ